MEAQLDSLLKREERLITDYQAQLEELSYFLLA